MRGKGPFSTGQSSGVLSVEGKNRPLRVLLVEDSEDDAFLVIRTLEKGGYAPVYERVQTAGEMVSALRDGSWDAVLCDYHLPRFGGLAALGLMKELGLDLPFIVVSGAIGEETAVGAMKAGAHDYIMKDNLSRLAPALARELREAEVRGERRRAQEETVRARRDWENIFQAIGSPTAILDSRHRIVAANQSLLRISGLSSEEILGRFCYEVYHGRGLEGPASGCPMVRLLSTGHTETCPMEMEAFGGVYLVSCTPVFDDSGRLDRVIHIATDITDRVRMEEALRRSEETYRRIAENMADVVWVTDLDLRTTYVSPSVEKLIGESVESHLNRSMEEKFPPESLERIRSVLLEELAREGDPHADRDRTRLVEVEHYRADGQTVWVAINVSFVRDATGKAVGLQGVTRDITERRHSEERIRKALGATVQAIVVTVEARDPYTAGHQRRVSDLARSIAAEMGLPAEEIDGIRMAGLIHDLGKISVPAEILSKPSRLSDLEFSLIRIHSEAGYEILKDIEFPWPIARMVLEHHERMDGSGYPRGLRGGQLLPASRILAVADVVESMASHRPYRPAIGIEAALGEISANRDSLYDPQAVDACLQLFKKGYAFST